MSQQIVEQVKAELIAAGVIPADASAETDNRVPFRITHEVARRTGGLLFVKASPAQNGYTFNGVRYSHDAIAYPTGWVDCLVSAGPPSNQNRPGWLWHAGAVTGVLATPPPIAPIVLPVPPTPPAPPVDVPAVPPTTGVPSDIEARLQVLEAMLTGLALQIAALSIRPATVYDIPYDVRAPWPIGTLRGSFSATPRKA